MDFIFVCFAAFLFIANPVWAESSNFPEYQDQAARDYLQKLGNLIENQAGSSVDTRLLQARLQVQLGQKDAAERTVRECLAADSQRAEIPSQLADLCIQQDRLEEAAKYLRLAVERDARISGGYRRLGMVLDRLGKPAEARGAFEQAVKQTPDDPTAQLLLGRWLLDHDKAGEAIPHLAQACRLDPDLANAHYVLAEACTRQGDTETAQAHRRTFQLLKQQEKTAMDAENAAYDDAQAMRAAAAACHVDAASILMEQQQVPLAEAHLRQAIKIAPKHAESYPLLASLCLKSGRPGEARGLLEELVRLKPNSALCQLNLGTLLMQLKDYPAAVRAWRKSLELDPQLTEACHNLARYYLSTSQELTQSLLLCRRLVELQPSAANYDLLGWALYANGHREAARAAAATAVEKDPGNPAYQERLRRLKQLP